MFDKQIEVQDYFVTRGGDATWKRVTSIDHCTAIHVAYNLGTRHETSASFVHATYDDVHVFSLEPVSGWVKDDYEFYYAVAVDKCTVSIDQLPVMPKCDKLAMDVAITFRFNFGLCVPALSEEKTSHGTQMGSILNAMKAVYRVATGFGHAKASDRITAAVDIVHRTNTVEHLIGFQQAAKANAVT